MHHNFSYYSYLKMRDDGTLQQERRLMAEEQKLCKARARKFSLETNRRRMALDEKRKQCNVQEQRLRERILQERRLQIQDATERFQRAHLPPPQRHRQSFKRNVTNIEDALRQIQDTSSLYSQQSSLLSRSTNVSSTPPPKPPTASKSYHHQALSAVEGYTKVLQEQSRTETQHDHSPQGTYLSDSCISESLSTKDSLECEEPTHSTKTLQCSYSSSLLGTENAHHDPRKQDDLCHQTSELTSVSAMMLLGDSLAQAHKWHEPNQEQLEDFDRSNNKMRVFEASWGFTAVEQKLKTEIQSALHNCNVSALSSHPEPFEVKTPQSNSGSIITANIAALGNGALDSSCPKQEESMDPTQERIHDDRQLKFPTTKIPLPAKNSNSRDVLFGDPRKQNIFLTTTDNLSKEGALQQTGKENSSLSSHEEFSASINNLNKVSNLEPNTKKPINTESMEHTYVSNIQSSTHKCYECPEKEVIEASHSVCKVRFIKGILKKQSKHNDTTCVYSSGRLIFAKQVALAIRDSVELARRKTKDLGGNSTAKKKLRWLDEVHVEKEEEKQNAVKLTKGKSSNPCRPKNSSDDHQLSLSALSGTPKNGPSLTPAASAGYHFTKEAWADVHVSLPQQRADEVKAQRNGTRASGPKGPRRERPGRTGPDSSRTRKGTVIRPQSATEVSQIAKTQGKLMVPRPPPRMESVEEKTLCVAKTPYGRDHASAINKQAVAVEQVLHRNSSAKTHNVMTTERTVLDTPLIPPYTCPFSEGDTVSMPSSARQGIHRCRRRRETAHNERDLCLDCTPTEEEITQLWHGVRSALTTKDAIIKGAAVESGQVLRKACIEQSRQTPGSGNRRLLQTSQALIAADVHAKGRLEERDVVAAMETAQTQRRGTAQPYSRQQGLTDISLEEENVWLSLDRLDRQLQCVRHNGGNTGMHGLVLSDATYAREVKASTQSKHHASSANNRPGYQKRS